MNTQQGATFLTSLLAEAENEPMVLINKDSAPRSSEEIAALIAPRLRAGWKRPFGAFRVTFSEIVESGLPITPADRSRFQAGEPILVVPEAWRNSTATKTLWEVIVDHSPAENGLEFISTIVAKLAADFVASGHLPDPLVIGMMDGGIAGPELHIIPVGDIDDKLVKLAGFLADPRYADQFSVHSAAVADVSPENLGHCPAPKPGLMLAYDGLTVLTLHGDANPLLLNMEGFERSVIGLTDDLAALWARVQQVSGNAQTPHAKADQPATTEAQRRRDGVQRRENARQRQDATGPIGQLGLSLPTSTLRFQPVSAEARLNMSSAEVLLVPIRGSRQTSGAYPPHKLVQLLRNSLAVQTVLAEQRLRALLDDLGDAQKCLQEVLPRTLPHLRREGVSHLAAWTGFDTVGQVNTWADARYPGPGNRNAHIRRREAEAELAPVRILSQALGHAERVSAAYNEAERVSPQEGTSIMDRAYRESPYANPAADDLFAIAVYGDLNPVALWRLSEDYLFSFEIARFIGRVQAGAEAVLLPHLQPVLIGALGSPEPAGASNEQNRAEDPLSLALKTSIRSAFATSNELPEASEILNMLLTAVDSRQNLVVERGTRRMTLRPAAGTEPVFDLNRIYNPLKPQGFIVPIIAPTTGR